MGETLKKEGKNRKLNRNKEGLLQQSHREGKVIETTWGR